MIVTPEQQKKLWIELLGTPPEERQEGDYTAAEISERWKIDRNAVYKLTREGKLIKIKVYDPDSGKSIYIYRPAPVGVVS